MEATLMREMRERKLHTVDSAEGSRLPAVPYQVPHTCTAREATQCGISSAHVTYNTRTVHNAGPPSCDGIPSNRAVARCRLDPGIPVSKIACTDDLGIGKKGFVSRVQQF
eukprot:207259-Pyramimonas_sp.AAC.1